MVSMMMEMMPKRVETRIQGQVERPAGRVHEAGDEGRIAGYNATHDEIKAFKRLGRADRVFCLIVGGEPYASAIPGREDEECFPHALRFQLRTFRRQPRLHLGLGLLIHGGQPAAADAPPSRRGSRAVAPRRAAPQTSAPTSSASSCTSLEGFA